ncbi:MAG: HEAT repeat domain-containing protein [Deltaproteobacteria bacterium]|nr:HEAT repeat domain-containing protein [Deltaproteobacteria bacterium]MBW2537095.1 HEAT repeat domain-containing protein [Deltaproteobacteria bacterium]
MGLFDFFRRGNKDGADGGRPKDRKFAGLVKTATDKRAQAYDREEAIRGLYALGTPDAAQALLKRFTFKIDPSITDQEEKALAFDGIVRVGLGQAGVRADGTAHKSDQGEPLPLEPDEVAALRDGVVDAVRLFCDRAESLNWPLRVLRELLDDEAYERELLALLEQHDTEYIRNVEPKIDLITALEELVSPAVREAIETYLDDVNETVRFHAVAATFKQGEQESIPVLVELMEQEESVRVKNKVAEGMIRRGWNVPEDLRPAFAKALEDVYEYRMSPDGKVSKA